MRHRIPTVASSARRRFLLGRRDIAVGGATSQLFVFAPIGAAAANSVATSPDGLVWTFNTGLYNAGHWPNARGIIHDGTRFIALGDAIGQPDIAISTDGKTWTFPVGSTFNPSGTPYGLAYGNGVYVVPATGSPIKSWYSADATTWNVGVGGIGAGTPNCCAWVAGQNQFVGAGIVSPNYASVTSPDGINWTAHTQADGFAGGVATDGNTVITFAGSTGVFTSVDGINWTLRKPTAITAVAPRQGVWAPFLNLFIGCGDGIVTSPDGITWTQQTCPGGTLPKICLGINMVTMANYDGATHGHYSATSLDGITWIVSAVGSMSVYDGVIAGKTA